MTRLENRRCKKMQKNQLVDFIGIVNEAVEQLKYSKDMCQATSGALEEHTDKLSSMLAVIENITITHAKEILADLATYADSVGFEKVIGCCHPQFTPLLTKCQSIAVQPQTYHRVVSDSA